MEPQPEHSERSSSDLTSDPGHPHDDALLNRIVPPANVAGYRTVALRLGLHSIFTAVVRICPCLCRRSSLRSALLWSCNCISVTRVAAASRAAVSSVMSGDSVSKSRDGVVVVGGNTTQLKESHLLSSRRPSANLSRLWVGGGPTWLFAKKPER